MHRHLCLLLSVSLAAGCLQKVDEGLAVGAREIDPPACGGAQGFACMFPVNTTDPGVGLKADEGGEVTQNAASGDGCAKVDLDATDILQRKCAGCHDGPGTAMNSPLTFIMDPDQLMTRPPSMQFTGERYVLPGNPARSLIYQRAVINKDMPYSSSTLVPANLLTVSESSVLYQWIASCVGVAPMMEGGGAGGMAAGGSGAGGMAAGGMAAGGAGAGGAGAGGAGAGGRGAGGAGAGGRGAGGRGAGGAGTGGGYGVETGGTESGGTGGAVGTARPCDGLCANPTPFTVPPSFQSPGFGPGAACYQTVSALGGFSCGNANRRTFSINGATVDCAAVPALNTIPPRNGGYCVQATAGRNDAAFFSAN